MNLTFQALKKNLKQDISQLPLHYKMVVLGDTATQLLVQGLRGYGVAHRIGLEIYEADYDQIELQVMDPDSELYQFEADFISLFLTPQKLSSKFDRSAAADKRTFAEDWLQKIQHWIETLNSRGNARILLSNIPEWPDAVFGNYANKTSQSWLYQVRKLNLGLMELAQQYENLFINDLAVLQYQVGARYAFDPKVYATTSIAHSLDFLPIVARNTLDLVRTVGGKFKKCLILDLDNTTWGGVIGDDGVEGIQVGALGVGKAFSELQRWAKNLKDRGIILCICSKNTESVAREPFEQHPEMTLRLDDISVFVANWENKADNIRFIQSVLNIGFDSMVFLDDNPFERNLVRTELPAVTVPELPVDPVEYMPFIRSLNLFETASFSGEDAKRTQKYQQEAERAKLKQTFGSIDEYLESLRMKGFMREFDDFHVPRTAQLTQRSNQFNLRTVRYDEKQIRDIIADEERIGLYVKLQDKFGEYGLISLLILEPRSPESLFIDTWLMSCRVLKRDVEKFVLNELVRIALEKGYQRIVGEYLPTPKNKLVEQHYDKLGFEWIDGLWVLELDQYQPFNHYIEKS